jgi:DNA-binding NtrC family response regulator
MSALARKLGSQFADLVAMSETMTESKNGGKSLNGVRVLIVEDDPLLLLDLESTLSSAGAVVVGLCQTLDEALRRSEPTDFAVAVLDFRLGDETASPVARRLEDRGVPFVFYTGQARHEPSLAEWRHRPIVEKPSPPHALVCAVKEALPH